MSLSVDEIRDMQRAKNFDEYYAMRQRKKRREVEGGPREEEEGEKGKGKLSLGTFITTARDAVGNFIEGESTQYFLIGCAFVDIISSLLLLFLDAKVVAMPVITDLVNEYVVEGIVLYPIVSAVIFNFEIALMFFAVGIPIIFHWGYLSDVIVIAVSLSADLSPSKWRNVRLLAALRLWRVVRLVNTKIRRVEDKVEMLQDALEEQMAKSSELEIAKARAEDSASKEKESRNKVEQMCQVYKSEVETLREALQIAAQTVAEWGSENINEDDLLDNEELIAALAAADRELVSQKVVIKKDGKYDMKKDSIDGATSEYLVGPDWNKNMIICDSINSDSYSAPYAVDALTAKLSNKDPNVVVLAITLAETLVKNCGSALHRAIATAPFMTSLAAVGEGKRGAAAQGKALEVIQSWGVSFEHLKSSLPLFYETYVNMKVKGARFPAADVSAPVFTPSRSVEARYTPAAASDPYSKLRGNIEEVKSKSKKLESLLAARRRGEIRANDDTLLDTVDFLEQCKIRTLALIEAGVTGALPEDLLGVVFQLNDDLEQLLATYSKSTTSSTDDDFSQLARRNSGSSSSSIPADIFTSSPVQPSKQRKAEPETDFFSAMGVAPSPSKPAAKPIPSGNPFDDSFSAALPSIPAPSNTKAATANKGAKYDDSFDEFLN